MYTNDEKIALRQYIDYFLQIGCTKAILGHPIVGEAGTLVTVAFLGRPRANQYARFLDAGWEVYGHAFQACLPFNIEDKHYTEVTFRLVDAAKFDKRTVKHLQQLYDAAGSN